MYIAIGIIVIFLIYFLITYNLFIIRDNKVKEAFSMMDVYLKKRWDLIPNIVETVKGYSKFEKDALENVINLRNKAYDGMSYDSKIATNELINNDICKIMSIFENYPELKANENFLKLQTELTRVENDIAQARKYYNAMVKKYNTMVQIIPSNIIAKILGYKSKKMFEAKKEERKNVEVKL